MRYINKLDLRIVIHYLGKMMEVIGIAFLLPIIVAIIFNERYEIVVFSIICLISIFIGNLFSKIQVKSLFRLKHAMIIATLTWIWASLIGAIIMQICLGMPFIDTLFESMSSWTGTGFCLFTDIEVFPKTILFLKCYEGWLGGLAIVVLSTMLLNQTESTGAKIYRSEAKEERIKPSINNTMKKTVEIYTVYTVIGIILYLLAGLPLFDSVNLCFSSICTGGMGIKNGNVGYYNNYIVYIITMALMLIGATSFSVHYKIFKTKGTAILKDIQFRAIIEIIIITSIIIYFLTETTPMNIIFTLVSAITSTGATITSTPQLLNWGNTSLIFITALMLIGGSSGSTVGGLKVIRVITILKGLQKNVKEIMSPDGSVIKLKINNIEITNKEIKEAGLYIFIFFILIFFSWVVVILHGYDGFHSLFEVVSAASNNGLSTGIIKANMSPIVKITIIVDMLMGKLEIIPVLVTVRAVYEIFKPSQTQKRNIKNKIIRKNT